MAVEDSYAFQEHIRIRDKIDQILHDLPAFSSDYIYSKIAAESLQPRTRLAYLQEQMLFFKYLCSAHEDFMDYTPTQITTDLLQKLTVQDIEAYLAYCELYKGENGMYTNGATGKARKLAAIRSLLKYLVGRNKLTKNVAEFVETPSRKKDDIVYMNDDQQSVFLQNVHAGIHLTENNTVVKYDEDNALRVRDIAIISVLLGTGIRVSELVGINENELDFSDMSFLVTRKGGKIQKIYFSEDVAVALQEYLTLSREALLKGKKEAAFFVSQKQNRISVRSVQDIMKKYTSYTFGKDGTWKFSPHKLRSTFATNLIKDSGGDVYLTADALGHSDLSTVKKYAEVQNRAKAAISLRYKKE